MLILVAVTVNVAMNGGLFEQAQTAKSKTDRESERETLTELVLGAYDAVTGLVNFETLERSLLTGWEYNNGEVTTKKGNVFYLNSKGNITEDVTIWEGDTSNTLQQNGDNYNIYTAKDLAYLATLVNSGQNDFAGKIVNLMNDIDFGAKWDSNGVQTSGRNWIPIGTYTNDFSRVFRGTFNGNGFTISRIYCSNTTVETEPNMYVAFSGLFGVLSGGTIKNLDIENSCFIGTQVGAIAGGGVSCNIKNCSNNKSNIYGNVGTEGVCFAGRNNRSNI